MSTSDDYTVKEKRVVISSNDDGTTTALLELVGLYPDGRLDVVSAHQSSKKFNPADAVNSCAQSAAASEDKKSPEKGRECRMAPTKVYAQSIKKKKKKKKEKAAASIAPTSTEAAGPIFIKGATAHNHWPHVSPTAMGKDKQPLIEPMPVFAKRVGDVEINAGYFGGNNNNASIVFGRDRSGLLEFFNKEVQRDIGGSFGNQMGAGSIDIVVGRGAPFPVTHFGSKDPKATGRPIFVGPMYRTTPTLDDLKLVKMGPTKAKIFNHPGYMMDAARIYLSQMAEVDTWFETYLKKETQIPASAIALKADKIRVISRQDIALITSFLDETVNSCGENILAAGGISLVAGNGKLENTPNGDIQGIAKGKNTEAAIEEILKVISKFINIFNGIMISQQTYNAFLMNHFHLSPLFLQRTSPDYLVWLVGAVTQADTCTRGVAGVPALLKSLTNIKSTYAGAGLGQKKISSRYNKTN